MGIQGSHWGNSEWPFWVHKDMNEESSRESSAVLNTFPHCQLPQTQWMPHLTESLAEGCPANQTTHPSVQGPPSQGFPVALVRGLRLLCAQTPP